MYLGTATLVHASAPSPPWWAIPLVGGIFALIGVGISQGITLRLERQRRKREEERRLDVALREIAHRYLQAIQSYATFVTTLTVGEMLIDTSAGPTAPDSTFARYSRHWHAVSNTIAELQIVGPSEILEIAESVERLIVEFNIKIQDAYVTERMKYSHADDVYNLQRPFLNSIRGHFGLTELPDVKVQLAKWARD